MTPGESRAQDDEALTLFRAMKEGDHAAAAGALARLEALYELPTGSAGEAGAAGKPADEADPEAGGRRGGGLTDEGEFVPFYFTDPDRARSYARKHGFVPPDAEVVPPRHPDPSAPLLDALEKGYAGVVIDPGSPHPTVLTAEAIRAVLEEDVGSDEAASGRPTAEDESDTTPPGDAAPAGDATPGATEPPPPHLLDLEQRVRRSPPLDPVPPRPTPPDEARELLQELRELQMGDRMPVWEVVDTLAFQMSFFVPVAPDPAHGLRWPLVVRHPRDPDAPSVWMFTDPDEARRALEPLPRRVETVHLSGLEAFRWIWAVPTPVREVVIDLYPDSPPPLFVPDTWMLGALYPHFMDCPDLRAVRRVPLDEIGALPGARGTKPECVRALVEGWADLRRPGDGATGTVRHGGSRYLPATTGTGDGEPEEGGRPRERRGPGEGGRPGDSGDPDGAVPPFRRWLRESVDCSGVLLDPEGPAPLPLDHTDLAVLALWSERGEQPDGTDLAGLVEELREDLGGRVAGRILADWPRYYWALQSGGSGTEREEGEERATRAMTLPDRDTCPIFTSEESIRRFLEDCRDRGLVGSGMEALVYLSGWAFNVFREIHVRYRDGGWLDPDTAPPEEGMEVDTEMVRSALARLELRLQPRIPGFLAEP